MGLGWRWWTDPSEGVIDFESVVYRIRCGVPALVRKTESDGEGAIGDRRLGDYRRWRGSEGGRDARSVELEAGSPTELTLSRHPT